eukprot:5189206-Ditylum_brightwellii.AAC.1
MMSSTSCQSLAEEEKDTGGILLVAVEGAGGIGKFVWQTYRDLWAMICCNAFKIYNTISLVVFGMVQQKD